MEFRRVLFRSNRQTNWPLSQFEAILPTNQNRLGKSSSEPGIQGMARGVDHAVEKTARAEAGSSGVSEARQRLYSKLEQIVLKKIAFDAVPLSEVAKMLT